MQARVGYNISFSYLCCAALCYGFVRSRHTRRLNLSQYAHISPQPPPFLSSSSAHISSTTEKKHGTLPVVTASTGDKTVTVIKGKGARQVRQQFSFDNVFTSFSTQEEVFDETLKPVIR